MIYHITTKNEWAGAAGNAYYAPAAYAKEGFIHACKAEQIEGVLARHFAGVKELVVLHLEERKLLAPHSYVFVEAVNDEFPHIFGSINSGAIAEITFIEDD